jgi:hypothetical protein
MMMGVDPVIPVFLVHDGSIVYETNEGEPMPLYKVPVTVFLEEEDENSARKTAMRITGEAVNNSAGMYIIIEGGGVEEIPPEGEGSIRNLRGILDEVNSPGEKRTREIRMEDL